MKPAAARVFGLSRRCRRCGVCDGGARQSGHCAPTKHPSRPSDGGQDLSEATDEAEFDDRPRCCVATAPPIKTRLAWGAAARSRSAQSRPSANGGRRRADGATSRFQEKVALVRFVLCGAEVGSGTGAPDLSLRAGDQPPAGSRRGPAAAVARRHGAARRAEGFLRRTSSGDLARCALLKRIHGAAGPQGCFRGRRPMPKADERERPADDESATPTSSRGDVLHDVCRGDAPRDAWRIEGDARRWGAWRLLSRRAPRTGLAGGAS